MGSYVVVGDVSYVINIIIGVVGEKEIPCSPFVFGIGYVVEIFSVFCEMVRRFALLPNVDG